MLLVSACLLGLNTKYDGGNNANELLQKYMHYGKLIPVCPEQLGGLATPRAPVEIVTGDGSDVLQGNSQVVSEQKACCTAQFVKGAEETLKLAQAFNVQGAILKERSPSCGVHKIYDGSFKHQTKSGQGVTAALLKAHGYSLWSEEELTEALLDSLLGSIPDYLAPNLNIVFIGFNPGERSSSLNHHFAGRNNRFWQLLFDSALTPQLLSYTQDYLLPKFSYGLTNIVDRWSKSSSDLSRTELLQGGIRLRHKLAYYRPLIACFLGKDVYRGYKGYKSSEKVDYGLQSQPMLADIIEYVAPNPSGRVAIPYREKLAFFRELKSLAQNT